MARRKQSKVDEAIEQAYYVHSKGRTIDVFRIADLYSYCREALATGASMDVVMAAAVAKYCDPAGAPSSCCMSVEDGTEYLIQRS